MTLPPNGLSPETIFQQLDEFTQEDVDWASGRVFGYIFDPGSDILNFAKHVYKRFLSHNTLDFTVYPSLLRLENELAGMMRDHLRGDAQVVGNLRGLWRSR